jgi:hypothetical protein
MHPKLKLGAIASVMSLAVGLGITFAGPAAAATAVRLCVYKPTIGVTVCASVFPNRLSPVVIGGYPGGSPFDAPTKGTAEIHLYQSSPALCVELYKHNLAVADSCKNRASEKWTVAKVGSIKFGKKKVAAYFYRNDYKRSLCLTSPVADGQLYGGKCNFKNTNQEWYFGV